MNASNNQTQECYPPGFYNPGETPAPAALLWVALVHCYCVIVIGTLGNALALWCVGTCTKTRRPVKVLLFSVFLPALLVCLVTRPAVGETLLTLLTCDPYRITYMVVKIISNVYTILAQIELAAIAVVAVVRAVSVWSPQTHTLRIRCAALLVILMCLYSILTGVGLEIMLAKNESDVTKTLVTIIFFLNTTLPALITAAAYVFMIFIIQRNKRRLAASQQQTKSATTMDQATRAMLAVFISNLVFGLPHSIYHLMGKQPYYMHVIFHVLFSTHFVVDPLVFVYFNSNYRRRVSSYVKNLTQSLSSPSTSSFLQSGTGSTSDNNQQSSTNKQEALDMYDIELKASHDRDLRTGSECSPAGNSSGQE